ncbi:hypothetical protein ACSVDA_09675 [Cytobacillus sp. Hm23]
MKNGRCLLIGDKHGKQKNVKAFSAFTFFSEVAEQIAYEASLAILNMKVWIAS